MSAKFQGLPIDPDRLPEHIGIIMDGNGRWAKKRGLDRTRGHRAGSRAVRAVVRTCRSIGVPYLTLFAFSAQNWGRPRDEVRALMDLLGEFIAKEWQEIMEKDIRVIHLGELRRVPADVRGKFKDLIQATRNNRSMTLALALSYGSREEIARTARNLCRRVQVGKLSWSEVDAEMISSELYTRSQPDPDLIIRTGGESRVSNFLLWQSAYAEYYFSTKLWPDFTGKDLLKAIVDFQRRRRRFGLTDEQAQQGDGEG
jgi:undecaprenyl diphosphate synthase